MTDKKYEFVKGLDIRLEDGTVLHRIKALKDFDALKDFVHVKVGQLGGYIEKEENLSHEGNCWVSDYAKVYSNAKVYGNAMVAETAVVHDNAKIYGEAFVCDNAHIHGDVTIYGNSSIHEHAHVYENASVRGCSRIGGYSNVHGCSNIYENASVSDNAEVYEDASIHGRSHIRGNAKIYGDAIVHGAKISHDANVSGSVSIKSRCYITKSISSADSFIVIGPIGSRDDNTTFVRTDDGIWVTTGCFSGSIESFEDKVIETHGNNKYAKQYLSAIKMAKSLFCE